MDQKIKNRIIIIAVILFTLVAGFIWYYQYKQPGELDDFAKCLKDKEAIFYGAFWCSHCKTQKAFFGKSAKYLPYIECSTPDGKSQLPVCNEAKIKAYPTWKFSDGSIKQGELTLKELSDKTGCQLPQ